MTSNASPTSITPACLYSLAVYNPSLGTTDETLPDQIVFWTSRTPSSQNDSLNQIGLAQGIVEFARGFSKAQDLSSVDTQKSRVVILEPESGWWILAYIDLTRVHYENTDPPTTDYSPREVAPATVLLAQLRNSYNQFVFANGTFDHILAEYGRMSLTARLNKYYTKWAGQWDVMLSGNPAVDLWNGIRIGRGIGSEEKEVLRGFVDRNRKKPHGQEGLIDMIVSRFGASGVAEEEGVTQDFASKGIGRLPGIGDGCIYRGSGNLAPESVRDVADWVAHWVQYGDSLFKLSSRQNHRKKRMPRSELDESQSSRVPSKGSSDAANNFNQAGATTDLITSDSNITAKEIDKSHSAKSSKRQKDTPVIDAKTTPNPSKSVAQTSKKSAVIDSTAPGKGSSSEIKPGDLDGKYGSTSLNTGKLVMGVLTLGTYSAWDYYHNSTSKPTTPEPTMQTDQECADPGMRGKFVIGYSGDLEDEDEQEISQSEGISDMDDKITRKTVWITTKSIQKRVTTNDDDDNDTSTELGSLFQECRLVIYINYPMVFSLLFKPDHNELGKPSFYRALHYQLGPLRDPLVACSDSFPQPSGTKGTYDLIFDPDTLCVHTSLPNIPEPHPSSKAVPGDLPRIDALHIHGQLVKSVEDTRQKGTMHTIVCGERERTSHTTRGWWIGWMRLEGINMGDNIIDPIKRDSSSNDDDVVVVADNIGAPNNPIDSKSTLSHSSSSLNRDTIPTASTQPFTSRREAFIIRKSSDHNRTHSRQASKDKDMNTSKITEGLGIDPRKYFEQLLNFNART